MYDSHITSSERKKLVTVRKFRRAQVTLEDGTDGEKEKERRRVSGEFEASNS